MSQEPFSRNMDEMTSREVELFFEGGGDLVLVPFGPLSGHGAMVPIGMHAHWAHALALLVAERANGIVHPPVFTTYAGATRTFRGTSPFSITEQVAVLKRIARGLRGQGFRRVVLLAATTPEYFGGIVAARELFDETEEPAWLLVADRLLEMPEVKGMLEGYPGRFGENLIELASLRVLGKRSEVRFPELSRQTGRPEVDQPAEIAEDVGELRRMGAIGFRYHAESNHDNHGTAGLMFRGELDIDLASRVLVRCAELVVPLLRRYSHYVEWLETNPFRFIPAPQ